MTGTTTGSDPIITGPGQKKGSDPVAWARANLFSSWGNTLTTLVIAALLWKLALPFLDWASFKAVWWSPDGSSCRKPEADAC